MDKTVVIDIVPRLINDALNRSSGAYRANDEHAGRRHYQRFNRLWDQAIARIDLYCTEDWEKVS